MKYFDYEYRVRYGDTDKMGISYYANYFIWFEAARTEYFRALGMPYTECEARGYYLPVIEAHAQYKAPCAYDDLITIRTSVSEMKTSSIKFEYEVSNKSTGIKLVTGSTVHVFVDSKMRPVRAPENVKQSVTTHKILP